MVLTILYLLNLIQNSKLADLSTHILKFTVIYKTYVFFTTSIQLIHVTLTFLRRLLPGGWCFLLLLLCCFLHIPWKKCNSKDNLPGTLL